MDFYKKIRAYVLNNYKQINVLPGKIKFNQKCHLNAVHYAIKNEDERIAVCVCIDKDYFDNIFIHFLNVNKNGDFKDNTFGNWTCTYEYYFVKYLEKDDFFRVGKHFTNLKNYLESMTPWYIKVFKKVEV